MNVTSATLGAVVTMIVAASTAHACPDVDSADRPLFFRPIGGEIVSPFGPRVHPVLQTTRMHTGVDYAATVGDPVRAAAAGEVLFADDKAGYGKYVAIRHSGGFETAYAQLNEISVGKGDCIDAGAVIGTAGTTESGPHLHFEVLLHGRFLDPARMRGAPK
jgi:murein DD-endopeptidase MepM/ murein hydrolase activator NlpD